MKFPYKIVLCTVIVMALGLGTSGSVFVNYVFRTSLSREVEQALDESSILQFAFETAALNLPSRYAILSDSAVEQIGANLESTGTGRLLRLSDEAGNPLFSSEEFGEDTALLSQIQEGSRLYQLIEVKEHYYIQTGIQLSVLDRVLYLETMRDVTEVFEERTLGFAMYRRIMLVVLALGAGIMWLFSLWLTRPIRILAKGSRIMASGDYGYRAEQISNDELGELTADFNEMAKSLEKTVHELEGEVRSRETFIAAFAHELKTPLTAIIGYADVLRSRRLDDEQLFMASNYIYTEGKRLETLSFRLLEMFVTKEGDARLQYIDASLVSDYLKEAFGENGQMEFHFSFEEGRVYTELNLLKSVLQNLIDNACKASAPGGVIEVTGCRCNTLTTAEKSALRMQGAEEKSGYRFTVRDYGEGIPEEELGRITEAFYMVDKSRSRQKNGAGLGLALCEEILKLHHSRLEIGSVLGQGTTVSFFLPDEDTADE